MTPNVSKTSYVSVICGNETGVPNAEGGNMYTKAKHSLTTIFQPGRMSDSCSTGDQEDRVRSSGPAHLSVKKNPPTADSSRAAVGSWRKEWSRVLVTCNRLEGLSLSKTIVISVTSCL